MENTTPATILVILGVTGDLAAKKILPALFNLHHKQELPEQFKIVGFGRKPYTSETFAPYVTEVILKRLPNAPIVKIQEFTSHIDYVQGTFETPPSYIELAKHLHRIEHSWKRLAHYLFYLSVPPDIYEPIVNNIRTTPLYRGKNSAVETRVLVEKPIGKNAETANFLESLLIKSFRSEEIYRIDHYLAKEMVQNILTFRFANDIFERSWDGDAIEKIEIRLWEQLGVEHRGNFYDGLGALRDVGQNHLLQILALLTMQSPIDFTPLNLHAKRSEILHKLKPLGIEDFNAQTYRAQYAGYQTIAGVQPNSTTETYFKVKGYIDDARWHGVPIIIESGKRMHERRKEVVITYRHAEPCWCPDKTQHQKNTITFALEPFEGITINFWSKKPGLMSSVHERRTIDFMLRNTADKPQYIEEYEKLLLDSILGDQTLFVSTAEVKAMWKFIDPIIASWERNEVPLAVYNPDTDEAITQSKSI